MATVLSVLFWVFIVLIAILAGAFVTPVRLRGQLRTAPRLSYRVEASGFGGLSPRLPLLDSTWREQRSKKRAKAGRPGKAGARKKSGKGFVGRAKVGSAIPGLLADLLGTIHVEALNLDAEFGLPDPVGTGQLYGCLTPLQYALPLPQCAVISLRPDFSGAGFSGDASVSLRFTPAALVPPVIRFVWRAFGPRQ